MFSERKVAQMAAYILNKTDDKRMEYIKLIKLMYLADRQHYKDHGFPISYDAVFAMERGPVLSQTYDLIKGEVLTSAYWDGLISGKEDYKVGLIREVTQKDIGELSRSGMKAMSTVFGEFAHYTWQDLVERTHELPEWQKKWYNHDPEYGSVRIHPRDILEALGKCPDEIEACLHYMEESQKLFTAFASMHGKGELADG